MSAYACFFTFIKGDDPKRPINKRISGFCKPVNLTNMAAEIYAANQGLLQIKPNFRNRHIHITLVTSCKYLEGVINEGWNDSANKALFDELRETMLLFDTPVVVHWLAKEAYCLKVAGDAALFHLIFGEKQNE